MALWPCYARTHLGSALSQLGEACGLHEIEAGLHEAHAIGEGRLESLHLSFAADAYSRAGRHDEAKACIARALAVSEHDRDMAHAAELYRSRAAVLLRGDARERKAVEADLRRALEIARQQEALSLQLRAAGDLASLSR